ncbi:BTAD domain-containing putative transcriptional regulator [Myceligenerans indicum]|uniref:AfsR/SARP family transcriptional regulator n=1 Tax=Myceligenerans indicum TaxID=2593663 RepID=A0ABS1LGZ8_9MICO|nr:BTAD domain-containing putative transcriptional regulator [Myceligenerans indicum]MBL0885500.1 AfsR/SARP family transcriptional regulator [Myceligenerans indicum]
MQISMLGPFEVRLDDGVAVDVPGARLRALLVALALEPGRVIPKAVLVDWIWDENPPSDAANALQRLVSRLRKVLPAGSVEGHAAGYRLDVDPDAVDAVRFERLAGRARDEEGLGRVRLLREALALWRGAAMHDVGLRDGAAFDAAVTRLERLRLAATEDRFDAEIGLGHGADLVPELTDLVAADPVRERLVAALMRALAAAGQGNEALLVYERTREALADTLGADPSPELSAVHVALLRGELTPPQQERRTNLRAELTSFVGRDADVATVRDLVARHRLTTLIGPGGAGKTRLATETARTLLADLPDGAWLVDLAAVSADGDVAQATLSALGLRDTLLGDASNLGAADRIVAAVRERDVLLILDNCEHVIDAAAALADRLLGECRRLRILATSREPLGITGEAIRPVLPLALPPETAGPAEIDSAPSVRLLRERAGAVRQDLPADARTAATMARICRVLDGMPLAIELAAARLRTLSVDQLAARLDDRFRLLTSGSRTALPRHRTLRAMVDWSWELLTEPERTVLRRLSVFWGGASLEAAEQVCAGTDVEPDQVLDLLTALTDKSLVVAGGDGAPRYRLLGTIKEYATQRLADAGETEPARQAHLACFTELAETAEPHLRRAEQLTWLAVLAAEHDNLGAAMRGAIAAGDAQAAMRLAAGAGWYWWLSGHKSEGMDLIVAATRTPGDVTDETRAWVYALVSMFVTSGMGDEHTASDWIRQAYRFRGRSEHPHPALSLTVPLVRMLEAPGEAVAAWESLLDAEDPWVHALARLHLGRTRLTAGTDEAEGEADLQRALAEFQALGERFGISFALSELGGLIASRGELAAACEHYDQAVAVVTEVGAADDLIQLRSRQAQLHWLLGDEEASAAALAEARRLAERVTWPGTLASLALVTAELARWRGDVGEATRHLEAATTLWGGDADGTYLRAVRNDLLGYLADDLGEAAGHHAAAYHAACETGYPPAVAVALVGVADLALRRGDPEQAARLLGASAGVHERPDLQRLADVARIERTARDSLGDTGFAEAVREGRETAPDQVVAVTLAL